jgi:predicted permease
MPDWKQIVREHLRGLKLDGSTESEIFDELAQHLEDRYQEVLAFGTSETEAHRITIEPLLSSPSLVEALRRARRRTVPEPPSRATGRFAFLFYDLRIASRAMRQKPGFSFMVVAMLALGIGGNAAIFSTFNSLFLKPLPFPESSRLIDINETAPRWNLHYVGISDPDFVAWREHNTTFEGMAFFTNPDFNLSKPGPAQHIQGAKVTRDMLKVLGLKPLLGRNFSANEDRPHGEKVALLGYGLWQRLFSGDPNVLGRMLVLDEEPYKIIGVLPREALFPDRAEVWVPLAVDATQGLNHGWYGAAIGRLKRGVTTEQASADLLRIHRALAAAGQKANEITSPILTPLRVRYLGDYRTTSQVLLIAVAVVLLIACVNIAALMFVRASTRSREIAIRTAIGASRARIIRQLLTENAVLAAAGGIAGVLLGRLGLQAIISLIPDSMPRWIDFHLDVRFVAFCILITAAAALLFGLIPAVQSSRADMRNALHEATVRASLSRGRRSTLNFLVVSEIALALSLLISASLLLRAFYNVTHTDPGFRPENVLTFSLALPEEKYPKPEQAVALYQNLLQQLRALPRVAAAGAASAPPLGGTWGQQFVARDAVPSHADANTPMDLQVVVTPGYFDAIGMHLLGGRQFDDHDGQSKNHPVAIVSETFARRHWPGESAVGKYIRYQRNKTEPWWEVVGVVHNEKHFGLDGEDRATVYTPQLQLPWPMDLSVVVRSYSNPEALATPARRILASIDPDLAMYDVHTMTEQLERSLWARRAYSWLFGIFSLVALILAVAGIYGVISYVVAQRTQETGIRMAVGASPGDVLASILRSGMALVAAGTIAGLTVTVAAANLLQKLLFGVNPHDPLIYTLVVLAVAAVALLANVIPARRAASLDPMKALRTE